MIIKPTLSASDDIIFNLKVLAQEKETVRRKLVATAAKLATTAQKLAATAKEKEKVRRKLAVTAAKLATTAQKLAATAKEKEVARRALVATANEKENVRRTLVVTAAKLKRSHQTLEKKVLERTEDLQMARAKEGAVLQSIGDGLLATDEKGTITFLNTTAERVLGKKSHEALGHIFSDIIPLYDVQGDGVPASMHPVSLALETSTKTGATTVRNMYSYVRKDLRSVPLAITATPVVFGGKVIGTIEVFRDITSERETDKAKTEFVSLASHQLRTPLSTVNWYAEMLLAGDVGALNDKQTHYLQEVYRSNQRMVELVNALLDVSRLELGTFVIEPQPTDLVELVQNVIDEQKPQIDCKRMNVSFAHGGRSIMLQADPKLLRMVAQNLLSNAVKYTPAGGTIIVSVARQETRNVLLKVADEGYGIPKNQQNKIFTKLFRADNVLDKDTDGTGLGLYIVKSIVENSGGRIWFSSPDEKAGGTPKHPGTTFCVTLPLGGVKK